MRNDCRSFNEPWRRCRAGVWVRVVQGGGEGGVGEGWGATV